MKFLITTLSVLVLLLAGCGTAPKGDEVSVYYYGNRAPSAGAGSGGAGDGSGAGSQAIATARPAAVTAVVPADGEGPPGVPTVVYFDYDSFVVKSEFQSVVQAHGKFLIANRDRKVLLEGHADQRGGREYNLALGQKRSEAVRKSLVLLGVADNQLEAVSLGAEKPASTELSEKGYALNRRVEFRYR
ncbi:MAG: OmpA family protein [Pseudomonadota bacterium]